MVPEKGTATSIDTNKYHILTFKSGIAGTYSYNDGSIARVVWKREDESVENVSRDIVIKHFPDRWLMNEIVVDLKTILLEAGAGSPSHPGWTGLVNAFRIDPHESATAAASSLMTSGSRPTYRQHVGQFGVGAGGWQQRAAGQSVPR